MRGVGGGSTHHHLDALLLHWCLVIGGFAHSDQRVDMELLQILEDKRGEEGVSIQSGAGI